MDTTRRRRILGLGADNLKMDGLNWVGHHHADIGSKGGKKALLL